MDIDKSFLRWHKFLKGLNFNLISVDPFIWRLIKEDSGLHISLYFLDNEIKYVLIFDVTIDKVVVTGDSPSLSWEPQIDPKVLEKLCHIRGEEFKGESFKTIIRKYPKISYLLNKVGFEHFLLSRGFEKQNKEGNYIFVCLKNPYPVFISVDIFQTHYDISIVKGEITEDVIKWGKPRNDRYTYNDQIPDSLYQTVGEVIWSEFLEGSKK